jgi:hypothetical protein
MKNWIKWKKCVTGEQIAEGFCMPWGWGISRYCMLSDRRVIHPIPLNYIISFGWWLYYKLGKPWFVEETFRLQVEHEKYRSRWWADGWKAGWEDCRNRSDHWRRWEENWKVENSGGRWDYTFYDEPLTFNVQEAARRERKIEEEMHDMAEKIARETVERVMNE